jgi:hypothetical protein
VQLAVLVIFVSRTDPRAPRASVHVGERDSHGLFGLVERVFRDRAGARELAGFPSTVNVPFAVLSAETLR